MEELEKELLRKYTTKSGHAKSGSEDNEFTCLLGIEWLEAADRTYVTLSTSATQGAAPHETQLGGEMHALLD